MIIKYHTNIRTFHLFFSSDHKIYLIHIQFRHQCLIYRLFKTLNIYIGKYLGLVNCGLTPRAMTVTEDSYRSPTTRVPAHSPTSSCNTRLDTRLDTWHVTRRHSLGCPATLPAENIHSEYKQLAESCRYVATSSLLTFKLDWICFAKLKVFSDIVCCMSVSSDTHRPNPFWENKKTSILE